MAEIEKARPAPASDPLTDPSLGLVDEPEDGKTSLTDRDLATGPAAELARLTPEEYREMEKKLLWRIDKKLIPWMTLLYLMSFLDRVNVGIAKLVGMTKDLNLSSLEYSNISMIFFVSYVAFEVPSNLVLKKFRPSRWIPATMICWSLFQITMGLVKTYEQLLALRFCLGIFEAGLFPGLNLYLTGWYRREEINRRASVFFAGAVLAGAFGGIFGFALSKMGGVGGYAGWCWIFIWEGVLTLLVAVASFWMVHDWPDKARFLSPLEKEMVHNRLKREQGLAAEGKLSWRIVRKALKDWKVYCLMLMYIGAAEPLYSGSLFSPTIIASLGKWTTPQSLLLSTPPYVLCFIATLTTAYLSDKYRRRGFFLMGWSTVCIVGYAILMSVSPIANPGVQYFALFLTVTSTGPMIACTIAWTANTWAHHYKKAIGMGLVFSSGNSGGIVSSQAYRNKDAPRFFPGHGTAIAFAAMCGIMATIFFFALRRENARRDKLYGPPPGENVEQYEMEEYRQKWGLEGMTRDEIVELGDDHPAFRYIL